MYLHAYLLACEISTVRTLTLKVTDSYFYQTNTALYPVKSENSPTTVDIRCLLRKQKVDWLLRNNIYIYK